MYNIVDELLKRWFIMLVIYGIIGAIVLHIRMDDAGKKDVDFGAAIVSGVGIVYTVLLSVQTRRTGSAARFAERWNAVDFTVARRDVGQAIRGEKKLEEIDNRHLITVLNFFEEMSISIQMGEAQEAMLRKFFEGVVTRGSGTFRKWILDQQAAGNTNVFAEFLKLADRWSTKAQDEFEG